MASAPQPSLTGRNPGVQSLVRWLTPNPRLTGVQQHIAERFHALALQLVADLDDGPELTAGLRKLLEAKDCMIRQSIADEP